jgi:hypothetical protein
MLKKTNSLPVVFACLIIAVASQMTVQLIHSQSEKSQAERHFLL